MRRSGSGHLCEVALEAFDARIVVAFWADSMEQPPKQIKVCVFFKCKVPLLFLF